ncbi:hypothetical protein Pint_06747 [Pistacia integerrima]|nr:hypothetical protein Pint_06747 [Pistacia integerrima]
MNREERCWHITFQSLSGVKAINFEASVQKSLPHAVLPTNGFKESAKRFGGINVEVHLVTLENDTENEMVYWMVENLKFFVKELVG